MGKFLQKKIATGLMVEKEVEETESLSSVADNNQLYERTVIV